ncbi:MAG: LacI family DNA-binding transcriptional regulator [Acidobacteria bacterium]|nr:LacI family DNA-binding transcriptional regulator [Acidobacteriota bacterium]
MKDAPQPRAGVRDIARAAGVSLGTVHRALHGRADVNEKTRQKVLAAARRLGYQPNLTARALASAKTTIRIGVCIPRKIRYFYDQMRDGILEEAERYSHLGLEILYEPVPSLGSGEEAALTRMFSENVRAIVLTPGLPGRLTPLIDEAEKQRGIRVVCVASDDSSSARSTAISVEPRLNGTLAAELMSKLTHPRARVAVITGMMATEDHAGKVQGFAAEFQRACPQGQLAAIIEDHQTERESYVKSLELLRTEPELAGIYVSTANCLPVCRALQESGAAGRVKLITTDLFPEALPWFERNVISASIYQHPYVQGQTAIRLLVDHFLQQAPLPATHYLNPAIVLKANLQLFREIHARS